jgi:hypothetical protein
MRLVRNVDVVLLVVALPVFVATGMPLLGWAMTTVTWLAARAFQAWVEARAFRRHTRQAALGARAAALLGRLYLVTIGVFVAGLINRHAGVAAGVLAAIVFTAYFISLFVLHAIEGDAA